MKHVLYQVTARPMTIWGIPRIALLISVLLSTTPFPILALAVDQLIALLVSASLFGISWLVMKIISLADPDAILIMAARIRHLKQGDRYVA
jgi:type IV secretory pathway VirB3-like protein